MVESALPADTPPDVPPDVPPVVPSDVPPVVPPDASPIASASAPAAPPSIEPPARAPLTAIECGQALKAKWPALFAGAARLIKLRIQKDIQERSPGVYTRSVLSAFLHRHTGSTSYLIAVAKGGPRFDLDGRPDGEVSEEHRKVASDELARRRANHAARVELEQQQRHHRAGLLRDFERTTLTRANFCALKGVAEAELDGLLAIARDEAAQTPMPSRDGLRRARHEPRRRRPRT